MKKVFVSGCFDMLHSGHIAFFQEASLYGELYVALGSDKTVQELKGRRPLYTEDERKYMLEAVKYIKKVYIGSGSGKIDFLKELDEVKPDIFFVNEDGGSDEKKAICEARGIDYVVGKRIPFEKLSIRSTTQIREDIKNTLLEEAAR